MPILIDIEMPDGCLSFNQGGYYSCPGYHNTGHCRWCKVVATGSTWRRIDDGEANYRTRPSWCPLIEVKEVGTFPQLYQEVIP